MKKIVVFFIAIISLLGLASCSKYSSSYSAVGLVRSQSKNHCEASFDSLSGTLVFKVKCTVDGTISYYAKLEEGSLDVYYDSRDNKEMLFSISANEEKDSQAGYVESGRYVYIIIEVKEKARGKINIDFINQ